MRVLMIWSENLNKAGSGRTHFVHLARGLAECGCAVRIVAPGYPPRTAEDLGVAVSYVPVPRRSMFSFLLFHAVLLVAMPLLLLRHRPHIVYTRGLFHSFLVHAVCRLFGVRYVAEVDSIVDKELAMREMHPLAVRLVGFLDRWNLRWASAFVCVTPKLRRELVARGARANRVFAIHNGAAVDVFRPGDRADARRRLDLPQDATLVAFVGTLAAWQGLDLLVDAAARLPAGERPWQVLIVGEGEMRGALAERIAAGNLGQRVRLLPAVPLDQVAAYLQAADMTVIPIHDRRKLRYGLSALKFWEALSAGLPVLVPEDADLSDVLDTLDWPGRFATGDADDLARAIVRTADRLLECRARRDELHETIRRQHSWTAVARRTLEVFRLLTAGRKGVAR